MVRFNIKTIYFLGLLVLLLASCVNEQVRVEDTFSFNEIVPKCDVAPINLKHTNDGNADLHIRGIAFVPGTNAKANFKIRSLTIGDQEERLVDVSGGFLSSEADPLIVPVGQSYYIGIDYTPRTEEKHSALINTVFDQPAGVYQLLVKGESQGEGDCPEVITGDEVLLSGDVNLRIDKLVAVTNNLTVPLSSENGDRPFEKVALTANITGSDFLLPQITEEQHNFVLPLPDPTIPAFFQLLSVLVGDTVVETTSSVSGTYDSSTGSITLPDVPIRLHDEASILSFGVTLTTGTIDVAVDAIINNEPQSLSVTPQKLDSGGFIIIGSEQDQVRGSPIRPDGSVKLVGSTWFGNNDVSGPLAAGAPSPLTIRVEATVICTEVTTQCDFAAASE
jgi:hypothetical protein